VEEIRLTAPSEYIVETRRVGTSDLDLTSAADLKTLNGRISRAANQVCRDPGTNRVTLESGFCAYNARRDASEQVAALRSSALMASAANAVSAPGSITIVASR
jgi:UrcA family protein